MAGSTSGRPGTDEDDGGLNTPFGRAAVTMTAIVVLLWILELINAGTDRRMIQEYGIQPRRFGSLPDVVTAPFLHVNAAHLAGNCTALFSLGLVAALAGVRRFFAVTVLILLASGFGAWLIGPANTVGVGASGVVFGYLGYLLMRGLVDRRPVDIVVSIGIGLSYGYALRSALPTDERVSWQAHLFGLVGGLLAAWLFRRRRPKPVAPTSEPSPPPAPA